MLWCDATNCVRPMPSCSILWVLKSHMEEDMPAGIAITNTDHTVDDIRALARKCNDSRQSRRLRAIAHLMEGELSRGMTALRARVDRQTLCDWSNRYNAEGPDGLKDRPRSGRSSKLDASRKAEVRHWLEDGPGPGVPAWTLGLLKERIKVVFGAVMSLEAVRCLVRALGFRKVSPRPLHPKADPQAQEDFRRNFSELAMSALPEGTDPASVDIWYEDEARIGQKGMLTRVWALRGSRPRVPRDHRYGHCYLFSAICPDDGAAVGHVCDRANTQEMNRHLLDIGAAVPDGRHALVVLDGAGWHRSRELDCPENVSVLRLPPYSPELNPVETVFQFLKARHFANQVFETAEAVTERVAEVWEGFAASPDRIRSIGHRSWARLTPDATPANQGHVHV